MKMCRAVHRQGILLRQLSPTSNHLTTQAGSTSLHWATTSCCVREALGPQSRRPVPSRRHLEWEPATFTNKGNKSYQFLFEFCHQGSGLVLLSPPPPSTAPPRRAPPGARRGLVLHCRLSPASMKALWPLVGCLLYLAASPATSSTNQCVWQDLTEKKLYGGAIQIKTKDQEEGELSVTIDQKLLETKKLEPSRLYTLNITCIKLNCSYLLLNDDGDNISNYEGLYKPESNQHDDDDNAHNDNKHDNDAGDNHNSAEDNHDNAGDNHDNAGDNYDNAEDNHDNTGDNHDNAEDNHDNAGDNHDNTGDNHDNTEDNHDQFDDAEDDNDTSADHRTEEDSTKHLKPTEHERGHRDYHHKHHYHHHCQQQRKIHKCI
ncbi:hypothetical protein O3P69_011161 [Scylla paramamosain]|uniref:Uncharacterized protein n=1 Tax=Scylla paramamosain TaxID=85552 RepID=A0AAW0STM6_SCYPA